jgi:hypothetical protein
MLHAKARGKKDSWELSTLHSHRVMHVTQS